MSEITLIRTLRFMARHHYRRPDWSDDRNREAFGALMEPHPHEYVLEVAVTGRGDPDTGFVTDLDALDRILEEAVGPLRDGDLNEAIPPVREGRMLPSTENLARWFFERLGPRVPAGARLTRVRVAEGERLASEIEA